MEQWRSNGWLKSHRTDAGELANLLAIADRDLADAGAEGLSCDWKFGIAYNAALKLCTMLLYDAGYMPEKSLAHYRTLSSIVYTLGPERKGDAKRNHVEYVYVDGASAAEAEELLAFARELRAEVVRRLGAKYPGLGKQ